MARGRAPTQAMVDGARLEVWVETHGPFFTKDPGKTLYANIGDMLEKVAAFMQQDVRDQIASHAGEMPNYSGWSWAHTEGYVTSRETGKHWALWSAVGAVTAGMNKKDAIRTKAAAATIERRWHPYRRTKGNVYRAREVISADLTKGLGD